MTLCILLLLVCLIRNGLQRSLASCLLNGGPSHTRLGKIHFQRIAALSARDLGNRAKSRSFQRRADGRSLRTAQWKLIHTEISHHAPEEKKEGEKKEEGKKKVLSQSTNSGGRQKEQSVESRETRDRDRRGKARIVLRTHCPPPPLERVTMASLLSSPLFCYPSLSLSPSHHYSLQLRVGGCGEG